MRARVADSVPNEPECSGLKQTTSQRPTLVRVRPRPEGVEIVETARRVDRRGCGAVGLGEGGAERRRLVLEDGDVVERRDLARIGRSLGSERVELGGGQEGAILPGGGDRDPVAGEDVQPHRRGLRSRIERASVDRALFAERRVRVVEVDELATVGEARGPLDDAGAESEGGGRLRPVLRHVHVNMVADSLC